MELQRWMQFQCQLSMNRGEPHGNARDVIVREKTALISVKKAPKRSEALLAPALKLTPVHLRVTAITAVCLIELPWSDDRASAQSMLSKFHPRPCVCRRGKASQSCNEKSRRISQRRFCTSTKRCDWGRRFLKIRRGSGFVNQPKLYSVAVHRRNPRRNVWLKASKESLSWKYM